MMIIVLVFNVQSTPASEILHCVQNDRGHLGPAVEQYPDLAGTGVIMLGISRREVVPPPFCFVVTWTPAPQRPALSAGMTSLMSSSAVVRRGKPPQWSMK